MDLADDQRRKDGYPFRRVQQPGQAQEGIQKFRAGRAQADAAVRAGRRRDGIGQLLDHLSGQAPVQLQRHGQEGVVMAGLEDPEGVGHVDARDQTLAFPVMDLPVPQHGDLFSLHDDGCRRFAKAGRGGVAGLEPAHDQSGHGAVVRARAGHVPEQDLLDACIDAEQFSVRVEHGNILKGKRLQQL